MIVPGGEGPLGARLAAAGGRPISVPGLRWWCGPAALPAPEVDRRLAEGVAATTGPVLEALAAANPSVLLSLTTVAPWGALAAALSGRPHVWYVTDFGERGDGFRYAVPFEAVLQSFTVVSNEVLVVSRAVRERLFPEAAGGDRPGDSRGPTVVYPHLQVPDGSDAPVPSPFRRPGSLKLGIFGSIRESKGQVTALEALAELRRRGLDAELVVVGTFDDGYQAVLEERIRDLGLTEDVIVAGPVEDQYAYMRAVDVVLVSSRSETFSLVSLEAMLLEKPLVASPVGGIVEFLSPGVNGFVAAPDRPLELADRVEEIARDPEAAREMARVARREAEERFTVGGFGGAVHESLARAAARGAASGPRALPPALAEVLVRALVVGQRRLAEARETASARQADLARAARELAEKELALVEAHRGLQRLESTAGVRLLLRYWSWVERLAPEGSGRRRLYRRLLRGLVRAQSRPSSRR